MKETVEPLIEVMGKTGILLGIYVFIFSVIKIILVPKLRKFKSAIASFIVGFPSGYLVGMLSLEWGFGQNTSIAIACLSALIAERIILSILSSDIDYGALLKRALENIIDKKTK